jgi:hypothetical protein
MNEVKEAINKSKKTRAIDYKGAAIQAGIIIGQGALFALGSTLTNRLTAPRARAVPELTVVGTEEGPISIRKTAGNA